MRSPMSHVARSFVAAVPLFLATALMLATGGCKKPEYPACKKDKHCKVDEGEKCVDGTCQNCTVDDDCKGKGPSGEDFKCHEFRCTDPTQIPPNGGDKLGQPCTGSGDCDGFVCEGGTCAKCTGDDQCEGGTCDTVSGLCQTGPDGGGACTTDDDCKIDEICDGGQCVFSGVPTGGNNPCGIDAVFFDFDSPRIKPEAQTQLQELAECLKNQGNVILEAHADPRGTEEYNILLTDRRGQSVKKVLEDLGVTGDQMQVISKGDLEAQGTGEDSWKQDRRVEFIFP